MMTFKLVPSAELYMPTVASADSELIRLCAKSVETRDQIDAALAATADEDESEALVAPLRAQYGLASEKWRGISSFTGLFSN